MLSLVFAVHGLRSALNNTTALARLLIEQGHDVTFVSFRDVRSDVEHIGARFVRLQDGPDAIAQLTRSRERRGDLRSALQARRLRKQVASLAEPMQVLKDLHPDLVVVDMEMHGIVLAATSLGLETVHTLSWHDPMRAWKRPPMHTELVSPVTRADGLRVRAAWVELLLRRRARQLVGPLHPRAAIARVFPQQLNTADFGTVRQMARAVDVNLNDIASRHQWINPVTYTHRPILSYTVSELELDQDSPTGITHIGPMIDLERFERSGSAGVAASVDGFIRRFAGLGKKLAYCSMGSLQAGNVEYYQRVIDAFGEDSTWGLILGLGSRGKADDLQISGANTLVLEDAPQLHILKHCDVAIHTGGASAFYECLKFGVPSIVMHTGKTDMAGIAARVSHFRLGRSLDPAAVSEAAIYRQANRLSGGEFATELDSMRRTIATYEHRRLGVELIEALAQR